MRIISKYSDYYDCIQSYGFDNSCMYIRKEEDIKVFVQDYQSLGELSRWGGLSYSSCQVETNEILNIIPSILLYCGKVYPMLAVSTNKFNKLIVSQEGFENVIHDLLESNNDLIKNIHNSYYAKVSKLEKEKWYMGIRQFRIKEFFELNNTINLESIFYDTQCPLLNIKIKKRCYGFWNKPTYIDITKNPSLKDLRFFEVKCAFEAFTDIRNFITQKLGGNSPSLIEISNKDKIIKQGFDYKSSFRKSPTKKK